jgi:hypothetical protein
MVARATFCCVGWSKNRRLPRTLDLETYLRMGHVAVEFSQGRVPTLDDVFLKKSGYSRNMEVIAPDTHRTYFFEPLVIRSANNVCVLN